MYKNREDVKPHLNDAKLDSNFLTEGIKKYNMDILSRKTYAGAKIKKGWGRENVHRLQLIHSKRDFL